MGVALYIQGYEKKEEAISGEIKILGWYEVKTDEIEKYKIDNSFTVIHNELNSIKHAIEQFWNYGFDDPGELTFSYNIMNNMSGGGYRNENGISYGLMFDGERILSIVDKVLSSIEHMPLNPSEKEEEKGNLMEMQKVLKVITEKNGIVGIMLG